VVSGRGTRAFRTAHHDVALDGTNAPSPSFTALAQGYLKGRKLVRQHCQMSKVPLQVLSVSLPEGSTLTARYAKIF
jgi:hypothetical protein